MTDKFSIFSPTNKYSGEAQINFKKSPNKFMIYESLYKDKEPEFRSTSSQVSSNNDFGTLKKLPYEYSTLRQTMSYQKLSDYNLSKYGDSDK